MRRPARVREDRPATAGRYLTLLRSGCAQVTWRPVRCSSRACCCWPRTWPSRARAAGARLFAVAAGAIGACAAVVGLRACARPESLTDWPAAVRTAARDAVRDPGGSGLVLLALVAAALCGWMLLPLAFLAPGPLALALTSVDVRLESM
ncbi:hypothetical protein [Streptomyces sp. F001]|uniref:hypothetical protein n=1 Tax=Streptomyces sp. F001 TaxID=1510026 RepID=UPI001F0E617D|nr:hypothetical protein [Streptomyces sp. F001]